MAQNNRLGKFGTDGATTEWPEVNINGSRYERGSGSLAHIGSEHFVVLPIGFVDDGRLARLREDHLAAQSQASFELVVEPSPMVDEVAPAEANEEEGDPPAPLSNRKNRS